MHLLIRIASNQQENRPDAHTLGIDSNQRPDQAFFTTGVGVQGLTNLGISE